MSLFDKKPTRKIFSDSAGNAVFSRSFGINQSGFPSCFAPDLLFESDGGTKIQYPCTDLLTAEEEADIVEDALSEL